MTANHRYWLSIVGIAVGTFVLAGLAGGAVAVAAGERSLFSGVAIVAIVLPGWFIGFRVHERKKLDLPLWRSLDTRQARRLAQYREWMRSGRLTEPSREEDSRTRRSTAGRTSLSRRDRTRLVDVERRRADRRHRQS